MSRPAPPRNVVSGSEGAIEELASQNTTIAAIVEELDSWALAVGSWRISAFDVLFGLVAVLLLLTAAWLATRLTHAALRRLTALDGTQRVLAEKIVTIVIWVVTFFLGVDLLGIDLTALAVFSGAFGLAIGFGLQKTFGNLISGIILLLDKSIKPGDVISLTDQAGQESFGQIRKIGIRAISVVTRDKTEYLIPNETLMINQVVNWSYSSKEVRVKAPVGVSYNSDLDLVERLLYQAVDETKRVLKQPRARVNIMGFGDNSVDFEVRFWIEDPEEGLSNIRSDVLKRVWQLFHEHGVEIPFPQRDLHLKQGQQLDRLIAALERGRSKGEDEAQ
ncbi:mechanosensitive ion channel family protein [Erythrobacter dokdonensis]|uniref:Mechanosensitive ion channel family protein n=1 Tax=Erythrobacter dokdonensis DSW-74 TaxID=1300349 RepID=A0A1A7BEH1_9SPHN|nr:mechanosensitive ion channel domain-containing protein [Erythrobacter dokdonensis]OBV10156.1 Mechanosensitive ion channel family protein [Erythrobacter dokdonensis DSW-74]